MSLWYGQIRTFILEVFIEDIWQDAIVILIIHISLTAASEDLICWTVREDTPQQYVLLQ